MRTGISIYIIGSVKRMDYINNVKSYVEDLYGETCFISSVEPRPGWSLEMLIEESFSKIKESDMVIVVSKPDGTLGDGVTYEKVFADLYSEAYIITINPSFDLKSQFGVFELLNKLIMQEDL